MNKIKRHCFFIIGLTVFVFSFSGCDALYRLLHKEGAQEKELVGETAPFEKNPTVEDIQSLLALYGYNPGKIDGVLGLATRNAIERFQKDNALEETRFVDDSTWMRLKRPREAGLVSEGKLNIKFLQEVLAWAGFDPGPADGKWGPKTKRAVERFQESYQLKKDGKVGYKTLSKLTDILQETQP